MGGDEQREELSLRGENHSWGSQTLLHTVSCRDHVTFPSGPQNEEKEMALGYFRGTVILQFYKLNA